MELEKIEMKKYFKKNKVYFGDTVMEIRKLKKKDDYFYIYVDKDVANNYVRIGGEIKGKYYCFYAREIEWGNKDGIERIERML
jgi:hypothetical protein